MAGVQHIVCELSQVDIGSRDVRAQHGYRDSAKRFHLVTGSVVCAGAGNRILPPARLRQIPRDPHAQRVQFDEAAGIGLVAGAAAVAEGGDFHVEHGVGLRLAAGAQQTTRNARR